MTNTLDLHEPELFPAIESSDPQQEEFHLALGSLTRFLLNVRRQTLARPGTLEALLAVHRDQAHRLFSKLDKSIRGFEPGQWKELQEMVQHSLHSLTLDSPAINRCYLKPLGYAGDYKMVAMIADPQPDGPNLFAQFMNLLVLEWPMAEAHRQRLLMLEELLAREAGRVSGRCRVLNVGCGPAEEVRRFIRNHAVSESVDFLLLDFNQETLDYARAQISATAEQVGRKVSADYHLRSVYDVIKGAIRSKPLEGGDSTLSTAQGSMIT